MKRRRWAATAVLLLWPLLAQAGGLRLSPLRLDLSAQQTSTHIELENLDRASTAVQIKAFAWTQVAGRDVYEPTKDIFFAPPIVTVPAQGKTTVRFRLRAKAPAQAEAAYRIYFQEIPPAGSAMPAGTAFRIRFGVPLFVAPGKPAGPRLAAATHRAAEGWSLTLANDGAAHLKIEGVALFDDSVNRERPGEPLTAATHSNAGANYLLPGTRQQWQVRVPDGADPSRLQMLVRTNDYTGRASQGMTPRGWLWLPLSGGNALPQGN